MVAVRMVSEGVDVPRLAVGVYATSTSTPLFFAQAIGRFVRARKRGETASVFLPSVPILMYLAQEMEAERDHALDLKEQPDEVDIIAADEGLDDHLIDEANAEEKASSRLTSGKFEAIGSQASFHGVMFDGEDYQGYEVGSDDQDFLGIPGLLDADQVGTLLKQRHEQSRGQAHKPAAAPSVPDHRQLKDLRQKLAKNVSAWAARTGEPHGAVHNALRRECGGPPVAQATAEQIQSRIDTLQRWFIGRR